MSRRGCAAGFSPDQTPERVFDAIDKGLGWSGDAEGSANELRAGQPEAAQSLRAH